MQQNQYLELGKINTLQLDRLTVPGAYLLAQDGNDVLLPGQYLTQDMKEGDLIDVFLYTDSEDRLVATTLKPTAMLDELALFEVVDTAPFGAFMDWGLSKDLLVPNMFQYDLLLTPRKLLNGYKFLLLKVHQCDIMLLYYPN